MPSWAWFALGIVFVVLGLVMLIRRYLFGAVDSERTVWPVWALLAVGLLMMGGQTFLKDLLDMLGRFAADFLQKVRT